MSNNYSRLMRRLDYHFDEMAALELALSHRSFSATNNERLEFIGDSILNFIIAETLYRQFPTAKEGDLSRMRAQLVKGVTLAELAREFELGEDLLLGPGEMKSGGFRRESILADAVEAIIGAIYMEAGLETCRDRVLQWFAPRLQAISPSVASKDAKTQLQELLQARKKILPVYQLVSTEGPEQQQSFVVSCAVDGLASVCEGRGSNRRSAEQAAAGEALKLLQDQRS